MEHTVIRASAGSGKTYQLSNRYLTLLLRGTAPETILATTFTRKAAAEIFDRILLRLARAVANQDAAKLLREIQLSENAMTQDRLNETFSQLIRNFDQIKILTLDSFANSAATKLGLELGLPLTWRVIEDPEAERLIHRAIALALIDRPRTKSKVKGLIYSLFNGESTQSLSSELKELLKPLFSLFRESDFHSWHQLPRLPQPNEKDFDQALSLFDCAPVPLNKSGKPDKRISDQKEKVYQFAKDKTWEKFFESKLTENVVHGIHKSCGRDLPPEFVKPLQALCLAGKSFVINQTATQTEAAYEMLSQLTSAFYTIQSSEGKYRFDDITWLLGNYAQSETAQMEPLIGSIRHLLLDEFQDTSTAQWKFLLPIVQKIFSLSEKGKLSSFFCVGDIKQAIYGWRGGSSEIFGEVENTFPVQLLNLAKNWRSAPQILGTVNQVFTQLSQKSPFARPAKEDLVDVPKNKTILSSAQEWESRFVPHESAEKNRNLEGKILFETVEEDEQTIPETSERRFDSEDIVEKPLPPTIRKAIDHAETIFRNEPHQNIGILLRRNQFIGRIVAELGNRGIDASQEGGVPLCSSPAVRALVALLRVADHPGDTIALYVVTHTPPLVDYFSLSDQESINAPRLSYLIREEVMTRGFLPFIRRIIKTLSLFGNNRDEQLLQTVLRFAVRFESAAEERLDRFRELIEGGTVELASASRIRVMTIHKAKGLEFDTVILPDLDWEIKDSAPEYLPNRESPTAPILSVHKRLPKALRTLLPEPFQKCYSKCMAGMIREMLNLLYVALTRAVQQLILIVPKKAIEGNRRSIAVLLAQSLSKNE